MPAPLTLPDYLRAIPLDWKCDATAPEVTYSAVDGSLDVRVFQGKHGISSVQVTIGWLGSECVGFDCDDEAPFLIRHLIGKLVAQGLDRMTADEVKALVPPWAQYHVQRQLGDEVLLLAQVRGRVSTAITGLQADSDKRLALAEKLHAVWRGEGQ